MVHSRVGSGFIFRTLFGPVELNMAWVTRKRFNGCGYLDSVLGSNLVLGSVSGRGSSSGHVNQQQDGFGSRLESVNCSQRKSNGQLSSGRGQHSKKNSQHERTGKVLRVASYSF
ncbi:hypothetical protein Hanom_Chr12g01136731 [Helianthus anomalus]